MIPEWSGFENRQPTEVEVVEGFWFAWAAFHPKTSVYTAAKDSAYQGIAVQIAGFETWIGEWASWERAEH